MASPQTLAPGTWVRFKGNPLGYRSPYAIVLEHHPDGGLFLETEGSDRACVARHEVSVMRNPPATPLRRLRHRLPYGKWTCADGREVLFNRNYKPIWQRRPGQPAEAADPAERVRFERQEWFYSDVNQPWRNVEADRRCNAMLSSWGLPTV